MGSISHHITSLVINSLGGGHTHTHTYIYILKFLDRSNSKKPGRPGLIMIVHGIIFAAPGC